MLLTIVMFEVTMDRHGVPIQWSDGLTVADKFRIIQRAHDGKS
jgi:hypothetical protein